MAVVYREAGDKVPAVTEPSRRWNTKLHLTVGGGIAVPSARQDVVRSYQASIQIEGWVEPSLWCRTTKLFDQFSAGSVEPAMRSGTSSRGAASRRRT